MSKFENNNQTQFSFEEPFETDVNVEIPVTSKPVVEKSQKSNKKKYIIIVAVVFLLLLLVLILKLNSRKKPVTEIEEEQQAQEVKDLGPIEQRIQNAREDLEIADPSRQDLTFPPVDFELRIDPPVKR
ncbi:hypothetical protein KA089_01465 [Candidatus Woesebacteria bacterium]|nr:hypothetical protein [Candidatus Woesebacteria bacterium]